MYAKRKRHYARKRQTITKKSIRAKYLKLVMRIIVKNKRGRMGKKGEKIQFFLQCEISDEIKGRNFLELGKGETGRKKRKKN